MNKSAGIILTILICVLLNGCYDKIEIENRGFTTTVGIEKSEDLYNVNVSIPEFKVEKDEGNGQIIKSAKAKSIAEALENINANSNFKIYLGQSKVILIDKEVANDKRMCKQLFDYLDSNHDIRKNTNVLINTTDQKEIMSNSFEGKKAIGKYITDYYKNNKSTPAIVNSLSLEEALKSLNSTNSVLIPCIKQNDKEIVMENSVIIKDYKIVSNITKEEGNSINLLKNRGKGSIIRLNKNDSGILLRVDEEKTRFIVEDKNNIRILVSIKIEGRIIRQSMNKTIQSNEIRDKEIKKELEEQINSEVESIVSKLQSNQTDVLNIRDLARKKANNYYKRWGSNWDTGFKKTVFNIKTEVKIVA